MNLLLKNILVIYGFIQSIICVFGASNLPDNFKISILKDSLFTLNIDVVRKALTENKSCFIPIEKINYSLNNKADYWFFIKNNNQDNGIYVLEMDERLSRIDVFPFPYDRLAYHSGLVINAIDKQLPNGKIILEPNSSGYLIKVQNHFNTLFRINNIKIEPLKVYHKKEVLKNVLQGLIMGFMGLMLVYNLLLLLMAKNTMHLFYLLYILFNFLFLLFNFGYSDIYLFPNNYRLNLILLSFQLQGVFFYVLFIRKAMLNHCSDYSVKKDKYIFHFLAYFVLICNLCISCTVFIRMDLFTIGSSISNVVFTIIGLIVFSIFYKKSDSFMQLIMLGSVILFVLGYFNVTVSVFKKQTEIFYESGLMAELLLLTYALNKQHFLEQKNIEKMKATLMAELEMKNRELVYTAIQLSAKENVINSINDKISENPSPDKYSQLISFVHYSRKANKNLWNEFERHFNEIHPDFYKNLSDKYPLLTQNEVRLCAFMKLNLNTKEIACIIQKSIHSIESMRSRIRQKLELSREDNFTQIISQL